MMNSSPAKGSTAVITVDLTDEDTSNSNCDSYLQGQGYAETNARTEFNARTDIPETVLDDSGENLIIGSALGSADTSEKRSKRGDLSERSRRGDLSERSFEGRSRSLSDELKAFTSPLGTLRGIDSEDYAVQTVFTPTQCNCKKSLCLKL